MEAIQFWDSLNPTINTDKAARAKTWQEAQTLAQSNAILYVCIYICIYTYVYIYIQGVPLATEPDISLVIPTPMKIIATKFEQEYVRCVRNKEKYVCSACLFRCNIFIGVRIIKEMPGSVASGTLCI